MSITDFITKEVKNKTTVLNSLYKRPFYERGVDSPHFQILKPNIYQQADIVYVPEDKQGYKFILVIADVNNKKIDAVPVKSLKQSSKEIFEGIKTIYERGILKYPKFLSFDNGNEFKGPDTLKYLHENHINIKIAQTGRHRQQGTVERANEKLGTSIHKLQVNEELITNKIKKDWVDDLEALVKYFNDHLPKPITNNKANEVLSTSYSQNLLLLGAKVRTLLNKPINTYNSGGLSGTFRKSDIRWSREIKTITNVLITPNMPVMYQVDDIDKVTYTKQQLQEIKGEQTAPNPEYIRGDPKIERIVEKRIVNRKHEYLVKWVNRLDTANSWEPSSSFDTSDELKQMKRIYNATL